MTKLQGTLSDMEEELEEYGLVDDCPPFADLWDFALLTAGGSLRAADAIATGECKYAINWTGVCVR